MTQKKAHSAFEATANTTVGFAVAFTTQLLLFPIMGIPIMLEENLTLSAVFTVVSVVRSYCIRRVFNRWRPKREE